MVWVNEQPFPLRVEFEDDEVSKTWGATSDCIASVEAMNTACRATLFLSEQIDIGNTRKAVYEVILSNQNAWNLQVGNFVPGWQEFRTSASIDTDHYKEFLLQNDAWQFSALKSLSKYQNPFYSRITVYFVNDKLFKIVHWSAPYELP